MSLGVVLDKREILAYIRRVGGASACDVAWWRFMNGVKPLMAVGEMSIYLSQLPELECRHGKYVLRENAFGGD